MLRGSEVAPLTIEGVFTFISAYVYLFLVELSMIGLLTFFFVEFLFSAHLAI